MSAISSLIPELENVVQHGSPDRRAEMVRRVTNLFLEDSSRYNEDHIRLFDDVFVHLVKEIEFKARAELSRRLAPVPNAPLEILRRLANDDDIAIAGPVLTQSPRLVTNDLVAIARSKSQAHLIAISGRSSLDEKLTDVLVDRGNGDVLRSVAANKAAKLSTDGLSSVLKRAEKDGVLAEAMVQREDVPDHLFRELVVRAAEVVQRRLLAAARPETQAEIRRVLEKVSDEIGAAAPGRDFGPALEKMRALKETGELGESTVAACAGAKDYEETAAAVSELSAVPIEVVDRLMSGARPDPVLILCKAAGFAWETVRAVILARPGPQGKSGQTLEAAYFNFEKLSASTAQRVVRFWQIAQTPMDRAS